MDKENPKKKSLDQLVTFERNENNNSIVVFTGTFPAGKNGFAKIWNATWRHNDIKVTLKRSNTPNITIVAKMDVKLAEKSCNWKKESFYFTHTPWWSDENYNVCSTIFEEKDSKIEASRLVSFRGGNRIFIELRESCEYDITIPNDCDYETNLQSTEILGELPDFFSGVHFNEKKKCSKYLMERIENDRKELVEFSGTYSIGENGLVRVYQKFKDKINVVIKKVKDANVTINATIDNVSKKYLWTGKLVELPWSTDAIAGEIINIKSKDSTMFASQILSFKGGNRIAITLNDIGKYVITVPFDTDFETDFESADIKIEPFVHPTSLHVDCSEVSVWGDNGSSCAGRQSWDYYSFGMRSDPYTKIKTNGKVNIPTKKVLTEWLMY
jgi:hypothetical protein